MARRPLAGIAASAVLAAGVAGLATAEASANPSTSDNARLAAYAAVAVVQAQQGVGTTADRQRAAVEAVQAASSRAREVVAAAGASETALSHADTVAALASTLSGLTAPGDVTDVLVRVANAAAQSVADFMWVPGDSRLPLNVASAPELRQSLTLDPEQGVVPACFVMPSGCYEAGHGSHNATAPSENYTGTIVDIPPLPSSEPDRQPSCTTTSGMGRVPWSGVTRRV